MRKKDRHRFITRLITENEIQKQEEFVLFLKEQGVEVTQATISRDIKELKLIKIPSRQGGYRYSLPAEATEDFREKLDTLLIDGFSSVKEMDKMVILRTLPGNASAIANLLEKQYEKELFALLNDDDNVLIIANSERERSFIYNELKKYDRD